MYGPDEYEELRRSYHLEVPSAFNYARDVVDARAAREPHKVALVAVDAGGARVERHTFADLARTSNRVANALAAMGIRRGDRVFVMLPRVPAWHEAILGLCKLGAVPAPGTTLLTPHDIGFRIAESGAVAAITDAAGAETVHAAVPDLPVKLSIDREAAPDRSWVCWDDLLDAASDAAPNAVPTQADDPLLLYFTSGTTGMPKMVLHTQASYGIGHEVTARFWMDLRPDDLHWTLSDTGWAKAAWGTIFGQWRMGAAVFLWDVRGKMDLERMLRLIPEHRVTTLCAPPTVFRQLIQMDLGSFGFGALRHVVAAGEPLNPDVIDVWRDASGLTIHDGYGQTETVNIVANVPGLPVKPGSMGVPTPGFDVRIVDDDGIVQGPGEEGHIAVRTEPERPVGLFKEYWKNPGAMASVFRHGWYFTGDRAYADDEGRLWFVGRADDVITSSAYRIGPFEVESALVAHPAVAEAAVVGKPDRLRGEIVKAFVTLVPGWEASDQLARELQEHCKKETAPYKYPREIEFVAELPKTASGKIRRVELRERERATTERG